LRAVQSPLLAGFAVSAADPNGFIAHLKEAFAEAKMLGEARDSSVDGTLMRTIVDELLTSTGRAESREGIRTIAVGASPDQMKVRAIDELKEVAAILDAKAPTETSAIKSWLTRIAQTVAEASGDGFLGFGGAQVNEPEKAALGEIRYALGTAASVANKADETRGGLTGPFG
jgi:hypothetical protein